MKRYDSYKKCNIPWVDEIPSHWEINIAKRFMKGLKELAGVRHEEYQRLSLTMDGVKPRAKNDTEGLQTNNFGSYQIIKQNDLVFKLIDLSNFRTSRVGINKNGDGIVSPAYIRVEVTKGNPKYFYYYFKKLYYEKIYNNFGSSGVRSSIGKEELLSFPVIIPDEDEQAKIAVYLDHKTVQIDALISNKKEMIEALKKYKKTLITEAVTKGLDKTVQMKDSNIQWIREIPEDWKISKIKRKFFIKKVINKNPNPTVLSVTQKGLKIKDLTNNEGQHAESYLAYQEVKPHDFVMNSMDLLTGFVDCSKYEGVTSPDYRVFVMRDENDCHNYFLYFFQMCYFNKIFYGHGQGISTSGRWRLQTEVFKNLPLIVPPVDEQNKISIFLDEKCNSIENAINELLQQIELLNSYRQSIICDAVTGKIDVRNYKESELEVKM